MKLLLLSTYIVYTSSRRSILAMYARQGRTPTMLMLHPSSTPPNIRESSFSEGTGNSCFRCFRVSESSGGRVDPLSQSLAVVVHLNLQGESRVAYRG